MTQLCLLPSVAVRSPLRLKAFITLWAPPQRLDEKFLTASPSLDVTWCNSKALPSHTHTWDLQGDGLEKSTINLDTLSIKTGNKRPKMPTEVFDLSPQQMDWLYEHQALKNVDALHHFDAFAPFHDSCPSLSPKSHQPGHYIDFRQDSTAGTESSTNNSSISHGNPTGYGSPSRGSPELVTEAIVFPFTCERPTWEQSLANLMCYKEHHGHCNVPRFYPTYRQLGSWVHRQRLKKKFPNKYGGLKDDQLEKLENIGFTWRVRKDSR